MMNLKIEHEKFISTANIESHSYSMQKILGDASKREYFRIRKLHSSEPYILMDSTQEVDSCKAFYKIGNFLLENGLIAPKIYHSDCDSGYMLLEDFGDEKISKILQEKPEYELPIYQQAVEILTKLSRVKEGPHMPIHNPALLNKELEVFIEWVVQSVIKDPKTLQQASFEFFNIFENLYKIIDALPKIVILRDYHTDNIMLLENDNEELQLPRLGLLDFQDALYGDYCYDLVSLLQDARRDVTQSVVEAVKEQYFQACSHISYDDLEAAYVILGIQRNLRILGVFNRLISRDQQPSYVNYLPRVKSYIETGLNNPILQDLASWFRRYEIAY